MTKQEKLLKKEVLEHVDTLVHVIVRNAGNKFRSGALNLEYYKGKECLLALVLIQSVLKDLSDASSEITNEQAQKDLKNLECF